MKKIILAILSALIFVNCIDEVDLSINDIDNEEMNILIIESTLTNEHKIHSVTLSRMDTLLDLGIDSIYNPFVPIRDIDRDLVRYESNATVQIQSDNGSTFNFNETDPGIYESETEFAAEMGISYKLKVSTADGKSYSSTNMTIEGMSTIANLYAEKTISESGAEGIGIFVDNVTESGNVQNLRYTYDETYKIIAPNWTPEEFLLTNYEPCALPEVTYDLEIIPREQQEQICYGNSLSNSIIQAQQGNLGDNIKKFMVRFINRENYIISHRYSIEVSQLVSNAASFSFYDQLNNFSQTGNLFSQIQPGFLQGNLSSDDGKQDNVIGFFDVVSITKKRLFFDYTDFYPNEELPPYPFVCEEQSAPESHLSYCWSGPSGPNPCPQSIIEQVNLDLISYIRPNTDPLECEGPYIFVPKICSDCTLLGSNVEPEFWEE